jgi:hypothetical protein
MMSKMKYPFKVSFEQIEANADIFIDNIFDTLQSSFLLLPRGPGFITYQAFQQAYEVLKRHTQGFTALDPQTATAAFKEDSLTFIVMRAILGFTPPELAYIATEKSKLSIPQSFVRSLDRRIRTERVALESLTPQSQKRVVALITAACQLLKKGADKTSTSMIHRLDKADTRSGLEGMRHLAAEGVPYAMLLYERFLGRPFASHRDSVSELVGAVMEDAVEEKLREASISFRKTQRAERIEGFDQTPDFIVPDEWNPQVVIEAKITEDDGTARDKITRIQHLAEISRRWRRQGRTGFQVIACIDGRGFGVRREDMRKLLVATRGKVFSLQTLDYMVESTELQKFKSAP